MNKHLAPQQDPENPWGAIVPCANCGRELRIPRVEVEMLGGAPIACSSHCASALKEIENPA